MKSRILAVLFAVVLTAGTLAGCGSSKKADDTKAETTDEKSEDKASSDEDTKDVNVASEEEAEEAGFSDGTDTDGATVENTVLDTSQELTGIHHADISIRDYGDIKVELDADTAPITVTNFVKLAQEGFYDGLTFWRIIDGFMMQGGDPKGNGTGGSGETIKGEFSSNGVKNDISHVRGIISMARSTDPDSASSQFFIVQSDSTFLDGDYAAFGHVTEGMDIVDKICKDTPVTDTNGTVEKENQPVLKCYNCMKKCNPKEVPYCITKALVDAVNGDINNGLIFCGANVGRINEMTTVHELMEELINPKEKVSKKYGIKGMYAQKDKMIS